jgi:hypothetical protein
MFNKYKLFSRAFEDEKQAKLGVVECVKHGLLEPYNVLWEKEGIANAQLFVYFVRTLLIWSQNKTEQLLDLLHLYFLIGEFVAQFKFTLLLMPNGPIRY